MVRSRYSPARARIRSSSIWSGSTDLSQISTANRRHRQQRISTCFPEGTRSSARTSMRSSSSFRSRLCYPPGSTKLAAWAVTYLGDLRNDEDSRGDLGHDDNGKHLGELRQVDRMGNPGVNTVLIRTPLKDAFNFGLPQNDARDFAGEIAGNLIRYGVDQNNVLPALATVA